MIAKLFSLLSVIMLSIGVSYAEKVKIGDLYYNLNDSNLTAEVAQSDNYYEGLSEVIIPATVAYNNMEYSVTSIGNSAFDECYSLKSIEIPNSVTSIGDFAFYRCENLISIDIPRSVTSIGIQAFQVCSSLKAIDIPSSVTNIGKRAFDMCSSLTSISVEAGNTTYDSRDNCNAIIETATNTLLLGCQNTVIPSNVTIIGEEAFNGHSGLTTIGIPSSVISIEAHAFSNCTNLQLFIVDEENSYYSSIEGVLYNKPGTILICYPSAKEDNQYIVNDGTITIQSGAFNEATQLTSITIPPTVSNMERDAFCSCNNLAAIHISDLSAWCAITYSVGAACATPLQTAHHLFLNNEEVKDLVIPADVTEINNLTFSGANLTSIQLHENITMIGDDAFYSNTSIQSITCHVITPPAIGAYTFGGVDKSIPLYVPAQSVEAYQADSLWSEFTNILAIPSSEVIEETVTACGNEYVWHEMVFTESGDFTIETDSTMVVLHLTLIQPEYVTDSATINYGETFNWRGRVYSESGIYTDTLRSMESGCDSVICELVLTVLPEALIYEEAITACGGEYVWHEMVFTESGDYTIETDSTMVVLHLTLIQPEYVTDSATINYGETFNWRGRVYSESGIYLDTTIMSMQPYCDSVISCLYLKVLPYTPCFIASGTCGDSLTWTLSCDSVLTVSGSGEMSWSDNNSPWYDYRSTISRVMIEDGVTSIAERAFNYCNSLTSVIIPNSVTSIGNNAFYTSNKLTSIEIPNSVTSIGRDVFSNCYELSTIKVDPTNSVYDSRNNCNAIIETSTNTLVVGCQNTVIPNNVTSIGFAAFSGCKKMRSIDIPNSVTSIGDYAFYVCSGLETLFIGEGVTSISSSAFTSCYGLITISIAEGNTVYDSRDNCNAIISTASNMLLLGCRNSVIPGSVTSIGNSAFYGCSGLDSIEIPNSITSIGSSAFYSCSGLSSIDIPNSVTSIGSNGFHGCSSLTTLSIPGSVASIGSDAFSNCAALVSITVDTTNAVYDSRDNCNAIIETATNALVVGCQSTIIPNSVTSIGFAAYSGCSTLTSLVIPASVTNLADYAFYACRGLTHIICKNITPPTLGVSVFSFGNSFVTLYVPSGSIAAYQGAEGWSEFTNIRAIVEEEETIIACGGEYVWRDMILTESGDYTVETDSVTVVLHLTLIQPEYVTDSVTIYDNDSLVWKGRVLRESGLYCDTLRSEVAGCDSLITCLDLTVLPYVPPTVTIFGEEVVIIDPEDSTVIVAEVDILGDSTLIYTPADNTLTLSDVLMEAGDSVTAAISYTGSDPLTIVLCDSSTIVADTVISSASDIIITGTGTLVAEGVVPIVGAVQATITFDSVSMIVRSLSSPAAVRRRIRGVRLLDENGGPALSGFATADFNKTAVTPPEAEYGEVTTEESAMLEETTNALFVRNADGTKTVLTEFVLTAIADPIDDAVENISQEGNRAVSKCLINGQLYILLPDGTRYTATGLKME